MKTLLNKLTIAFAALLCIASVKAQIPDRFNNLSPFKMRAQILSSLNKPHTHTLNDMRCSKNAPCLKAQTSLGGSNYDEGHYILQTRDGGFIVCGLTFSNDGDFHATDIINGDAYIAKYNKLRQLEWTKTYGGSGNDVFNNIAQTYDGGYIATGQTTSNDGDVSGNHGNNDVWLVKLSASGKIEWQKCFGGSGDDFGEAVLQTFYGGYAVSCFVNSNDGDISGNHNTDGNFDGWFFQVGPKGNLLFQHCYGGSDFDGFFAMVPSYSGSFILYGASSSNDGDVSGNHGNGDAWVVKVNAFGKILWQRAVGGSGSEAVGANEITTVNDGNVVIDGGSNSHDGDINASNDTSNSFVIKLNAVTGSIIWSKSYTEPSLRYGVGIFATKDGGTVETGDVVPSSDLSTKDVLISRFDKNGNEEWYKTLGGSDFDGSVNGYETFNGDLNILCETASTDGDVKYNHGNVDEWIIKLGRCGERLDDEKPVSDNEDRAVTKKNPGINNPVIKLYPNPANDVLKIEGLNAASAKTTLSLFNASGKMVQQSAATGETYSFNLQNLAAGSYYIRIESDKKVTTLKFVKE